MSASFNQSPLRAGRKTSGFFNNSTYTGNAAAGQSFLLTQPAWWDPKTYVSGNLSNRGTLGSGQDMVLGASSAAPTFSADSFVFDGVDDFMDAAHNAALNMPGPNNAYTVWIVIALPTTPKNFGACISKGNSATVGTGTSGYVINTNGTTRAPLGAIYSDAHSVFGGFGALAVGQKSLILLSVRPSGSLLGFQEDNTALATAADTRGSDSLTNTSNVRIGGYSNGVTFQNFNMYGAGMGPAVWTSANISDVGAYYGMTI